MKKLLLLCLVFIQISVFGQSTVTGSITVNKKAITYRWDLTGSILIFSDGKSIPIISVVTPAYIDFTKVYAVAKAPVAVTPPIVIPPVVVPPVVIPPSSTAALTGVTSSTVFKTVGTGKGTLDLGTLSNVNIKITPGAYDNISYDAATNVIINATGVTMPNGNWDIDNSVNVEIYGFSVTNQPLRAMNIRSLNTGLNIHDCTFTNIGDYVISFEYAGAYDGTSKTLNTGSRISNCTFTNTSQCVSLSGGINDDGSVSGLTRGFKFLNNNITNCPTVSTILYAGAADDIEIAGNVVDKINTVYPAAYPNGIHNGIFAITGNGTFHNNKFTNHQGNAIRFWGLSFTTTKKTISIYNNVVWNTWKYGAFELQVMPYLKTIVDAYPTKLAYTDAFVYNNTAGTLSNSKDWNGEELDLYTTGGTVTYSKNLGFNMFTPDTVYHPIGNMINDMHDSTSTTLIDDGTSKYFDTWNSAVSDLTTFKSLITGVGATL